MNYKNVLFFIFTFCLLQLRSSEKKYIDSAYEKAIELDTAKLKNTCPWPLLKRAIIKNDIDTFNFILVRNPEFIDYQGEPYNMSLLMIACLVENVDIVKKLLSLNAQIDLLNYFKETALMIASKKKNLQIVDLLTNVASKST